MTSRLPTGKLPARTLEAMLSHLPQLDPRVLVGPRLGEDAAVLDFGDRCLVVTTDPITFATDRIGWYALGVTVCGGHTEITTGLTRPIVIGQMLGDAPRSGIMAKDGLRPGDRILLTRGAAIEGTAILAREKATELRDVVAANVLARAEHFLLDPGISVVTAALAAAKSGGVRAMHDPTEGGIATGLYEMAAASGLGLLAEASWIPVYPETEAICKALGLDPLRLIASGALLLGVEAERVAEVIAALAEIEIPCVEIATVEDQAAGILIREQGIVQRLEPASRDEIARAFSSS
jgi:hydrogenase expression/formation protein HypE